MNIFSERLKSFIECTGNSITGFEVIIGVSKGTIYKAIVNKKTIGVEVMEKIVTKFPELNADWLITGRGDMQTTIEAMNNLKVQADYSVLLKNLIQSAGEVKDLKAQLSDLRYTVELQKERINELLKNKQNVEAKLKSGVHPVDI